jgi:integrase
MKIEEALILLEERAERERLRSLTIRDYESGLRGCGKYYSNLAIEDITQEQVQEYINVRRRRDSLAPSTLNSIRAGLKFFYNVVLEKNYDFAPSYRNPKRKPTEWEFFTKDEIAKFIEVSKQPYRLIFALMYHFELDRREVLGLKVQDVEKQADGGTALRLSFRESSQAVPQCLSTELHEYLNNTRPAKWVFEVTKGNAVNTATLHTAFHKSLMIAGIHKKLTPKSIAASHAEHSKQAGALLIDQIMLGKTRKILENFVDTKQIDELRQIQSDKFDLRKLIRLCEELNGCYINEWFFAASILQRAILDHVPPIFACRTFSEVVNNHGGGKSFKSQMGHLQDFARTTADGAVHGMIRDSEVLLSQTQVDFRSAMSTLIAEIIRILK